MNILEHITKHYQQQLPFVVYRKPNKSNISGFFQSSDALFCTTALNEKGFVFAPFDDKKEVILIPDNQSEFILEEIEITANFDFKTEFTADFSSKDSHIKLVGKGIAAIEKNEFKKVVLSRREMVKLNDFDLLRTFKKLLQLYQNAFVYIWFHPKVGLWLGATPETLLKVKNNRFETMSLAGTQPFEENKNVKWSKKEIDEQQFVTDFIVDNLKPFITDLQTSKVETVKAGSLLHLKTKITGTLSELNKNIISVLHPTPAVCGLPKNITRQFILENENYDRSFYTGYLGEVNNKETNLFVNLRCMEIEKRKANIYIGGGITKDSNSVKEWEETVAKAEVMKKVL